MMGPMQGVADDMMRFIDESVAKAKDGQIDMKEIFQGKSSAMQESLKSLKKYPVSYLLNFNIWNKQLHCSENDKSPFVKITFWLSSNFVHLRPCCQHNCPLCLWCRHWCPPQPRRWPHQVWQRGVFSLQAHKLDWDHPVPCLHLLPWDREVHPFHSTSLWQGQWDCQEHCWAKVSFFYLENEII